MDGGVGVLSVMLFVLITTLALPVAAATMNSASRNVPGPRSLGLVTFTVSVPAARPGAPCLEWYDEPSKASTPSSRKVPAASAIRLLAFIWASRTLQNEDRVPRTLDRSAAE